MYQCIEYVNCFLLYFYILEDPGYLNVSVIPGLTNLTVMWSSSPSGGSPDYYNVTLMNGTAVVYDTKNVQSDKMIILNLHNNTLYQLKVAAINCASSSVYNSSASTCKLEIVVLV